MKFLQTTLLLAALTASTFAGESVTFSSTTRSDVVLPAIPPQSLYNAGEWQIDLFGTYAFSDSENRRLIGDDVFGGGAGFNYFITRNFGLGVEGTLFDTDGDILGTSAFNLLLRFPIADTGFAPYIYGGVGFTFNADDLDSDDFRNARDRADDGDDPQDSDDVIFLGHAGVGLEYRFSPHFSLFADGRYNWSEKNDGDFGQVRTGVRFTF